MGLREREQEVRQGSGRGELIRSLPYHARRSCVCRQLRPCEGEAVSRISSVFVMRVVRCYFLRTGACSRGGIGGSHSREAGCTVCERADRRNAGGRERSGLILSSPQQPSVVKHSHKCSFLLDRPQDLRPGSCLDQVMDKLQRLIAQERELEFILIGGPESGGGREQAQAIPAPTELEPEGGGTSWVTTTFHAGSLHPAARCAASGD